VKKHKSHTDINGDDSDTDIKYDLEPDDYSEEDPEDDEPDDTLSSLLQRIEDSNEADILEYGLGTQEEMKPSVPNPLREAIRGIILDLSEIVLKIQWFCCSAVS
jgi:hypothetical protein